MMTNRNRFNHRNLQQAEVTYTLRANSEVAGSCLLPWQERYPEAYSVDNRHLNATRHVF